MNIPTINEIACVLDCMLNDKIVAYEKERDFHQTEANSHIGAMESRYDTFKEEAQYRVDAVNGKLEILKSEKILLAQVAAAVPKNNMFSIIDISTAQIFLAPVLGGDKIDVGDRKALQIMTHKSPLGKLLLNVEAGDEVKINNRASKVVSVFKLSR